MKFTSDRAFQLWAYSVSHAQLLIRSPIDAQHSQNLDVAFFGVHRMNLISGFVGVEIDEVDAVGARRPMRRFVLRSGGRQVGEIDAADIRISENGLDRNETDLPHFIVRSVELTS